MWDPPDQGSNPCPLHWQADSQPLRHEGSPEPSIVLEEEEEEGGGEGERREEEGIVNFMCQLGWAMVPKYLVKHQSGCC